jgi:DNA-binding NarL/FixJ family response regulator
MALEAPTRTVVIIEDDEDVAALLEALVAVRDGYEVVGSVTTVQGAETALTFWSPDVVVVGSHRDGFDAIDVVARARRLARIGCIVLLADLPDPITLLDALASGANTVLNSDAGWSELMPAVDLLLEARAVAA